MVKKEKRKPITITIDEDILNDFNKYCGEKGYKKNRLIERLIEKHLQEQNKFVFDCVMLFINVDYLKNKCDSMGIKNEIWYSSKEIELRIDVKDLKNKEHFNFIQNIVGIELKIDNYEYILFYDDKISYHKQKEKRGELELVNFDNLKR